MTAKISTLCLWMLAILSAGFASGQIRSGTIVGTVTDPAGAAIPEANVSATSQETNQTFELITA